MKKLILTLIIALSFVITRAQATVESKIALRESIGKQVKFADSVFSSRKLNGLTVFNLAGEFPKQEMTMVIFDKDSANFKNPIKEYTHKLICIKGIVSEHQGRLQIVVTSPKQILLNPTKEKAVKF